MGFPQTYGGAVANLYSGQHVQPAGAPEPMPLGVNVPCRRVLLVVEAGETVYVTSGRDRGQAAAAVANVGMIAPQIQADGSYVPMELWVNNVEVIWVCGAAGGETIHWIAEEF